MALSSSLDRIEGVPFMLNEGRPCGNQLNQIRKADQMPIPAQVKRTDLRMFNRKPPADNKSSNPPKAPKANTVLVKFPDKSDAAAIEAVIHAIESMYGTRYA
jgi:hypothetical protein